MAFDPDVGQTPPAVPAALSFDALLTRALGTLQRVAGGTWTDHNAHDPGITLLEQLCYALTDLVYRTAFPVQDLLAEWGGDTAGGAGRGVFGPSQVLPSGPVTLDDLRRLVIDLPGVKNAWIEPVDEPLARHDAAQAVLLAATPVEADAGAAATTAASKGMASPNVSDVRARGLYRVRIEKSGLGEDVDGGTLVQLAAQRLQQWRGLGEDVAAISVLDPLRVALDATIELAPGVDGAEVLAAVYEAAAQSMSPALPLRSLRELLERGWRVDQILEGPLLSRGFIDPDEWRAAGRRSALRLSDLIQALMAVPGVATVKTLGFLRDGQVSRDWLVPIAPDRCASFDLAGSRLRLESGGLRIDHSAMRDNARRLFEARVRLASVPASPETPDQALAPPAGRHRQVGRYLSLQHHLPPVYGVGPMGLSPNEPVERHAWADQLRAYLLLFDQLLANQFAQLAGVGRLLSFNASSTELRFAQAVADPGGALQFDRVRRQPPDAHASWLVDATRDPWGDDPQGERSLAQRHRQVDHLLARLGERWTEQRPLPVDAEQPLAAPSAQADVEAALTPRQRALRDKQAYLRDYPRLALRRGLGTNLLADPDAGVESAGLTQRLARLLGWPDDTAMLQLVEHIQLRPLPGDAWQQGPLMRAAALHDPFSLRLSLVLPAQDARLADADLRQRIEQTLHDEAPAHLALRLVWLDGDQAARFEAAFLRWRTLWRQDLQARLGIDGVPPASAGSGHQAALRSARNRVIDLLGLGDTFPLSDLTVAEGGINGPIKVSHGSRARITIDDAEAGVRYELRGPDGRPLTDAQGQPLPPVAADGADGRLVLVSPPVTDDITFRILATKLRTVPALPDLPAQAPLLLRQGATVKVGLDLNLAVELPGLPLLDTGLATPQPADARLCRHGERVRVQIHRSQEGVSYTLVIDGQAQAATEVGNLQSIELLTPPLTEDITIAVQASKRISGGSDGQVERELLITRLRVAVRADAQITLQPAPGAVIDHRQPDAVLRLASSQDSVRYQLWVRRVHDAEWLREAADLADPAALRAGPDGPVLRLVALPTDGAVPSGYVPVGVEPLPGTGGTLDLPLGAPSDDIVCLVRSIKRHTVGGASVETEGLLAAQALVLVRPDPAPGLQLALVQPAPSAAPQLRLAGGQPGVAYHFQPVDDAAPLLTWPAYVHQRSGADAALNKGLGQLAIGIDLAVATDADPALDRGSVAAGLAAERRFPSAPRLDLPPLPADAQLAVRAVKAQTGAAQALPRRVRLVALPQVTVAPEWPAPGQAATVQLTPVLPVERCQLWDGGRALGDPVAGDGGALTLATEPLAADCRLLLRITTTESDAGFWPLTRELLIEMRLLPRADSKVTVRRSVVAAGESTEIQVSDSQPGVQYQLQVAGRPVGVFVSGTGGDIVLATGPISVATSFSVVARRADLPSAVVELAAVVTVALQDLPPVEPPPDAAAPSVPAAPADGAVD